MIARAVHFGILSPFGFESWMQAVHRRRGDGVDFAFYWPAADRWEGIDSVVYVNG